MRELERFVILQVVDQRWREHLDAMDYLREGVHLRAMAQKDPLVEYRHEGHLMFEALGAAIREEVVLTLFHAQLAPEEAKSCSARRKRRGQRRRAAVRARVARGRRGDRSSGRRGAAATATLAMSGGGSTSTPGRPHPIVKSDKENIGRNDPCWCGSGKKFKKCHGA